MGEPQAPAAVLAPRLTGRHHAARAAPLRSPGLCTLAVATTRAMVCAACVHGFVHVRVSVSQDMRCGQYVAPRAVNRLL